MKSRIVCVVVPVLLVCAVACVGPSRVEENMGVAHQANVTRMIENPTAPVDNAEPAKGLDPTTAEKAMERHRLSQTGTGHQPKVPSIINVGIGTGSK